MRRTYPNKIKDEFDFINEEKTYSTEEIVNDYIFRCLEDANRAALSTYISTYGDPTNGLWQQVEKLMSNLVLLLERTIKSNDLGYSNFVIENTKQFLTKNENYKHQNQEDFISSLNIEELNDEAYISELLGLKIQTRDSEKELEKIKSYYYFEDAENMTRCMAKNYVHEYGLIIGKLFTNLESFHSQLLSIFEDTIKVKDESSYVEFISNSIDEFITVDNEYVKKYFKGDFQ